MSKMAVVTYRFPRRVRVLLTAVLLNIPSFGDLQKHLHGGNIAATLAGRWQQRRPWSVPVCDVQSARGPRQRPPGCDPRALPTRQWPAAPLPVEDQQC